MVLSLEKRCCAQATNTRTITSKPIKNHRYSPGVLFQGYNGTTLSSFILS